MCEKKEGLVSHCFKCGKSFSDIKANYCSNCGHELSKLSNNAFVDLMTKARRWEAFAVNHKEGTKFKLGVFYGLVKDMAIKFSNCDFILELVPTEKLTTVNRYAHGDCSTVAVIDERLKDVSLSSIDLLLDKMSNDDKLHRLSTKVGESVIITLNKAIDKEVE